MPKSIKELTEGQAFEVRNFKCSEPSDVDRLTEQKIRSMTEGQTPSMGLVLCSEAQQ